MSSTRLTQCIILSLIVGLVASVPTQLPILESINDAFNAHFDAQSAAEFPLVENINDASEAQSIVEAAQQTYYDNTVALLESSNTTCTLQNVRVRRAWDDLTIRERNDYVDAVWCMNEIPSRLDPRLVPGAKTLHDDFVFAHINVVPLVHFTALLLPWHRQFMWAYEQTLRTECNYTGALPYWDWGRHASNQSLSPVFQPSGPSFGGDGVFVPGKATRGCVGSGSFLTHIGNIGPINPVDPHSYTEFRPHCIERNFTQSLSTVGLSQAALATLYRDPTIHEFKPRLDSGIHLAAHFFVSGEMYNVWSSPNDPLFYLLHAQIDRVWTTWQGLDPESRRLAMHGTLTFKDNPPSENGTVDSVMEMGVAAGGRMRAYEAMDALSEKYCYMYT